jgi:hypothetical protein
MCVLSTSKATSKLKQHINSSSKGENDKKIRNGNCQKRRKRKESLEKKKWEKTYTVAEPDPLSLMPGPSGTLSKCAPITMISEAEPIYVHKLAK